MSRQGRLLALAGALLTLMAPLTHANGLNLSWDACGAAGVANKTFACNINYWSERLVLSARFPTQGLVDFPFRFTADLDLVGAQQSLPDWWSVPGPGACRPGAITARGELDETLPCVPVSMGTLGMAWSTSGTSSERRRLTITSAPGAGIWFEGPDTEMSLCVLEISHVKSTGIGSCSGCSTPVCIVFNSLQVFRPYPPYDLHAYVTNPLERNFVTWQGGATGMGICPAATPARNSTWGSLKSLYR